MKTPWTGARNSKIVHRKWTKIIRGIEISQQRLSLTCKVVSYLLKCELKVSDQNFVNVEPFNTSVSADRENKPLERDMVSNRQTSPNISLLSFRKSNLSLQNGLKWLWSTKEFYISPFKKSFPIPDDTSKNLSTTVFVATFRYQKTVETDLGEKTAVEKNPNKTNGPFISYLEENRNSHHSQYQNIEGASRQIWIALDLFPSLFYVLPQKKCRASSRKVVYEIQYQDFFNTMFNDLDETILANGFLFLRVLLCLLSIFVHTS